MPQPEGFTATAHTLTQAATRLQDEALRLGTTIATAESCTGGLIGSAITDIPGSSSYYLGGWVAYANAFKVNELGVQQDTLDTFGAVSQETVLAMSLGALHKSGAKFAMATSGIAGPTGATEGKPLGFVWFSICGPGLHIAQSAIFADRTRTEVKDAAAAFALGWLADMLAER